MSAPAAVYRPRNPQFSDYYRCVEDYFETFIGIYDEHFSRQEGLDDVIPCIIEPQGNEKAFRKSWARLIQKIYEVAPLICPQCQGAMRIISFIEDQSVIRDILHHPGLWLARARPPPKAHAQWGHDAASCPQEYAAYDLQLQTHSDSIYGDSGYTWDEYIQS